MKKTQLEIDLRNIEKNEKFLPKLRRKAKGIFAKLEKPVNEAVFGGEALIQSDCNLDRLDSGLSTIDNSFVWLRLGVTEKWENGLPGEGPKAARGESLEFTLTKPTSVDYLFLEVRGGGKSETSAVYPLYDNGLDEDLTSRIVKRVCSLREEGELRFDLTRK